MDDQMVLVPKLAPSESWDAGRDADVRYKSTGPMTDYGTIYTAMLSAVPSRYALIREKELAVIEDELIARVEKATGPDREIDAAVGIHFKVFARDFTSSLDAVIALVDRELPDHGYVLAKGRIRDDEPLYGASMCDIRDPEKTLGEAEHKTPALALLLAFLRSKPQ